MVVIMSFIMNVSVTGNIFNSRMIILTGIHHCLVMTQMGRSVVFNTILIVRWHSQLQRGQMMLAQQKYYQDIESQGRD